MNTIVKYINILPFLLLALLSCEENKTTHPSAKGGEHIWADTIIYEVLISNPDVLNEWETTKIKKVRQKELVDDLFEMIYQGKKKAFDYYTNKALTIADIQELEEEDRFSRDRVGKLQFTETWRYDESTEKFNKDVHSILLAYELYDNSNELRGYKAAFYLKDF